MLRGNLPKTDTESFLRGFSSVLYHNPIYAALIHGYFFIVSAGAIPMRLILRKSLGERAIMPLTLVACIVLYSYLAGTTFNVFVLSELIPNSTKIPSNASIPSLHSLRIFVLVFLSISIAHYFKYFKRSSSKAPQYSYHRGKSRFLGGLEERLRIDPEDDENWLQIVLEPLLGILVGITMVILILIFFPYDLLDSKWSSLGTEMKVKLQHWKFHLLTGLAITFSGLCLLLEELGIRRRKRGAILDLFDSEYDMFYIEKRRNKMQPITGDQNLNLTSPNRSEFNLVTIPGLGIPYENDNNNTSIETEYLRKYPEIDDELMEGLKNSLMAED